MGDSKAQKRSPCPLFRSQTTEVNRKPQEGTEPGQNLSLK